MKRKIVVSILLMVFAGIGIFAGWKIYEQQSEYQSGESAYDSLEQYVRIPDPLPSGTDETNPPSEYGGEATEDEDDTFWPEVDFEALQVINPDIVAWLYIEGTEINYPVVQGSDNAYYLKHLFDGTYNSSGCLFLDSRNTNDFTDAHSIIYGHHMKNGKMFAVLDGYKNQIFYDEHPVALLLTPNGNFTLEFFAGYVANVEEDAWQLGFTLQGFEDWLAASAERSCFESSITPAVTDKVVTLSTCSYEFNNARFVLVGILK